MVRAALHGIDVTRNSTMLVVSKRFLPYMSDNLPYTGAQIVDVSRNAVTVQQM
jgi:hypothetical protein